MVILQLCRWKFSHKETCYQTVVMHHTTLRLYLLNVYLSDHKFSAIKYCIKRPVHVILITLILTERRLEDVQLFNGVVDDVTGSRVIPEIRGDRPNRK